MSITKKYQFLQFISGMSPKSTHAVENLRKICEAHFSEDFEIEIIDISRDPWKANDFEIIGIPTLIKISPDPKKIIIGDLSDSDKVLKILDVLR